jgi:hypothetical protein
MHSRAAVMARLIMYPPLGASPTLYLYKIKQKVGIIEIYELKKMVATSGEEDMHLIHDDFIEGTQYYFYYDIHIYLFVYI